MKYIRPLACIFWLGLYSANTFAYNVVDRFKLIDDKLKTEQMLRPIGHDFVLEAGLSMTEHLSDIKDDLSNLSAMPASEKLSEAQRIITKYDKTEQTIKINTAIGIPLFRFSLGDLKVRPNLRGFIDIAANVGIRSDQFTLQDVFDLFGIELPADSYG